MLDYKMKLQGLFLFIAADIVLCNTGSSKSNNRATNVEEAKNIFEDFFPDVTYPTSVFEISEPFYYKPNVFDDIAAPFSDDVKSSYKSISVSNPSSTKMAIKNKTKSIENKALKDKEKSSVIANNETKLNESVTPITSKDEQSDTLWITNEDTSEKNNYNEVGNSTEFNSCVDSNEFKFINKHASEKKIYTGHEYDYKDDNYYDEPISANVTDNIYDDQNSTLLRTNFHASERKDNVEDENNINFINDPNFLKNAYTNDKIFETVEDYQNISITPLHVKIEIEVFKEKSKQYILSRSNKSLEMFDSEYLFENYTEDINNDKNFYCIPLYVNIDIEIFKGSFNNSDNILISISNKTVDDVTVDVFLNDYKILNNSNFDQDQNILKSLIEKICSNSEYKFKLFNGTGKSDYQNLLTRLLFETLNNTKIIILQPQLENSIQAEIKTSSSSPLLVENNTNSKITTGIENQLHDELKESIDGIEDFLHFVVSLDSLFQSTDTKITSNDNHNTES